MPEIIPTPEEIFRTTGRDIMLIANPGEDKNATQRFGRLTKDLQSWVDRYFPDTLVTTLGPSEYSGWITGGPTRFALCFTKEGLKAFQAQWGLIKDEGSAPQFDYEIMRHATWRQKHGVIPTMTPPLEAGIAVFCHTPAGIVHHTISREEAESKQLFVHPTLPQDFWFFALENWPELKGFNPDENGHMGTIRLSPHENIKASRKNLEFEVEFHDWHYIFHKVKPSVLQEIYRFFNLTSETKYSSYFC